MADNVEIQGIEFAVIGETKEAIKGLDNLGATLNRIRQAAKGGLGLNTIAHEIKNFNSTLNGTNFKGLGDIEERMSKCAQKLQETKGKIQSAFNASSANNFSTEQVNNATREISQSAGEVGDTFQQTDNSATSFFQKIKSIFSFLPRLASAFQAVKSAANTGVFGGLSNALGGITKAGGVAISTIDKLARGLLKLSAVAGKGLLKVVSYPFKQLGNTVQNAAS